MLFDQCIEKTQLLPDRTALLHRIPQGCITCEVGVAMGSFSEQIVQIIQPKMHFMIDSWNDHGRYDDTAFITTINKFKPQLYAKTAQCIRKDSLEGIADLPDASIDFLYLDTSHRYKETCTELRAAHSKITPHGIIAGHDYTHGLFNTQQNKYVPYGVVEAVNEFMQEYNYYLIYLTLDKGGAYSFALQAKE